MIGRLPDGSKTNILVVFVNTGYLYLLPGNLPDIKSDESKNLIMAYPAKIKEGVIIREVSKCL